MLSFGFMNVTNGVIQRIDVLLDDDPTYPLSLGSLNSSYIIASIGFAMIFVSIIMWHFYTLVREKEKLESQQILSNERIK